MARFIEGLSEHCDRWCERCPLTAGCRLFAGPDEGPARRGLDAANAAFWERLGRALGRGLLLVDAERRRRGLPDGPLAAALDFPVVQAGSGPGLVAGRSVAAGLWGADEHPLVEDGQDYAERVEVWIDRWREPVEAVAAADALAARDLADAVDVIRWYQHQVVVKLFRALADEEQGVVAFRADPTSAANGAVKVALLGLDRSIAAWTVLHERAPAAGGVVDLLLLLDRLRRRAEAEFPRARGFVRPGFDAAA